MSLEVSTEKNISEQNGASETPIYLTEREAALLLLRAVQHNKELLQKARDEIVYTRDLMKSRSAWRDFLNRYFSFLNL